MQNIMPDSIYEDSGDMFATDHEHNSVHHDVQPLSSSNPFHDGVLAWDTWDKNISVQPPNHVSEEDCSSDEHFDMVK